MDELNCRCCWAKLDADSISFRLNGKEASDGQTLKDKLMQCIPEIKITEKSEDVICVNCFALLTSAYNFRKMCLTTDERLREKEQSMEIVDMNLAELMSTEEWEANEGMDSVLDESVNSEFDESVGSELDCGVILNALPTKVLNAGLNGTAIYVCDRCKSLFLWREHYLSHECQGANSCSKCHQCNVSFRSNKIYEMHMKFMHSQLYSTYKLNDTIKIKLPVSISNTATKAKESTKVSSKSNDNNSKTNTQDSTVNITVSTTATNKKVKKTVDAESLKSNKKKKVERSARSYKCVFCKKSFLNAYHLQRHLCVHKAYCYLCLQCNRFEVNKDQHKIRTRCESTDFASPTFRDTRCPFCFKYFPTVLLLQEHLNIHKDFKKYCFTCYMQFDGIWETALHHISSTCGTSQLVTNIVMKGNTISCPVCKKEFGSKSNLLAHFRNHRANTIVCSTCNIPYYNSTLFIEHCELCHMPSYSSAKTVMIKEEGGELVENEESTSTTKEEPTSLEDLHIVEDDNIQNIAENIEKEETTVTGGSLEQSDEEIITTNHELENVHKNSKPKSSETVEELMLNIENIINKVGEQLNQLAENRDDNVEIDCAVNNVTMPRETEDEADIECAANNITMPRQPEDEAEIECAVNNATTPRETQDEAEIECVANNVTMPRVIEDEAEMVTSTT